MLSLPHSNCNTPAPAPHSQLQRGQGLSEYALILVLVSVLSVVALTLFGEEISSTLESVVIAVQYPTWEETFDHCFSGMNAGQLNSLRNQAESNPGAFSNRVDQMAENDTISGGCGKRLKALAPA